MTDTPQSRPRVGLFVTCLVDLFRPKVGFAAVRLLEHANCEVVAPLRQTCCGQPAYNAGDRASATAIARQVIEAFEEFDYVVGPSGSCLGMIRHHYPRLFADEPEWRRRAKALAAKAHELTGFLVDICDMRTTPAAATTATAAKRKAYVTYHDSCAGLREMKIKAQPRLLLESVEGLTLTELPGAETCCGFGGLFCIKYADISVEMAHRKATDIRATGAGMLLAGDMGCLLNMAGRLHREGASVNREGATIEVRHVAEVLAGMADGPAIGEGE